MKGRERRGKKKAEGQNEVRGNSSHSSADLLLITTDFISFYVI